MSVYGWYHWKNTDDERDQIAITTNNTREWQITVALLIGSFGILVVALMFLPIAMFQSGMLPPLVLQSRNVVDGSKKT